MSVKLKPSHFKFLIFLCLPLVFYTGHAKAAANPKVLIFFKTAGFKHESIPAGIAAIVKLGEENKFDVDTTSNSANFYDENLAQYAAVIFLNTSGDVLDDDEQTVFENYIHHGGGFVGIHSATDTEYDWNWYGRLVGAYYKSHPEVQPATLKIVNPNHLATKDLPLIWKRTDEWFNFSWYSDDIKFLIVIDENSYKGGRNGGEHPLSWYHSFDGGRSFYTALGHTIESYTEPLFLKHILGGIEYAMGKDANMQSNARGDKQ